MILSMVSGMLISFFSPLFVASLGSDLPECPDLEDMMMRDTAVDMEEGQTYMSHCTHSHMRTRLSLFGDAGGAIHSSLSLLSRLAGCMPHVCCWPAGWPRASVLPFHRLFFPFAKCRLLLSTASGGRLQDSVVQAYINARPLTPRKRQKEKFSLKFY